MYEVMNEVVCPATAKKQLKSGKTLLGSDNVTGGDRGHGDGRGRSQNVGLSKGNQFEGGSPVPENGP